MTGNAAELSGPAAAARARSLYRNAYLAGLLLVAVATFFVAKVTTTGSLLGMTSVVLAGLLIAGLWFWATTVGPRGHRARVVGMWVLVGLLAARSVSWFVAAGLPTQVPGLAVATLVACVAAPAFGVHLLSWSLELLVQPPSTPEEFRQLRLRREVLHGFLTLALVVVGIAAIVPAAEWAVAAADEPERSTLGVAVQVGVAALAVTGLAWTGWMLIRALRALRRTPAKQV